MKRQLICEHQFNLYVDTLQKLEAIQTRELDSATERISKLTKGLQNLKEKDEIIKTLNQLVDRMTNQDQWFLESIKHLNEAFKKDFVKYNKSFTETYKRITKIEDYKKKIEKIPLHENEILF
ncbi:MAG: hypothetical protein PHY93_19630 [Bacteriovorax sp.]|nr:hypothetical protein [Bacteriovorax sp.]